VGEGIVGSAITAAQYCSTENLRDLDAAILSHLNRVGELPGTKDEYVSGQSGHVSPLDDIFFTSPAESYDLLILSDHPLIIIYLINFTIFFTDDITLYHYFILRLHKTIITNKKCIRPLVVFSCVKPHGAVCVYNT
jgi:hypothetical protein